jgi:hypothetical protein
VGILWVGVRVRAAHRADPGGAAGSARPRSSLFSLKLCSGVLGGEMRDHDVGWIGTAIQESAQVVRHALASWGRTVRLCVLAAAGFAGIAALLHVAVSR